MKRALLLNIKTWVLSIWAKGCLSDYLFLMEEEGHGVLLLFDCTVDVDISECFPAVLLRQVCVMCIWMVW